MKWTKEAEAAVRNVPFFVRQKVRRRIEQQVRAAGKKTVTLAEVKAAQKRFLAGMEKEIKGFRVETCFGAGGCPNRILDSGALVEQIEKTLSAAGLLEFLKATVCGPLKFHHEFRVALADCPNACSQPQIKDMGIIAACRPQKTSEPCTCCGACAEVCQENALRLENGRLVKIEDRLCVACGKCVQVCPCGTLCPGQVGYRIQVGGKLGRHPRLATELAGIYSPDEVVRALKLCLQLYKEQSKNGQRLAEILDQSRIKDLAASLTRIRACDKGKKG